MKKSIVACIALVFAGWAMAAQECNVPKDQWMKEADFRMVLRRQGYLIKTVKIAHGCYEVYGLDPWGRRIQIYFNPATGVPLEPD